MQITFNFKNFEPSEQLKEYAQTRFQKLDKYLRHPDTAELQVNLEVEKFRQMADVTLISDETQLSAGYESEDMYASIDNVLDKLESQLRRIKDRNKEKRRKSRNDLGRKDIFTYSETESGQQERQIIKTDKYEPKPIDVDEAAMQLETLSYDFLVLKNAENDPVNVIYQRKNGDFGLIDPGM